MKSFILFLTLITNDPETGALRIIPLQTFESRAECEALRTAYRPVWLGNNNIGMHCAEEPE